MKTAHVSEPAGPVTSGPSPSHSEASTGRSSLPANGPVAPDVVWLGSDTLSTWAAAAVARNPGGAEVRFDKEAEARVDASVGLKHELIATQQPIYGVTTGFGDSAFRQIAPEKASALQHNLIQGHLNGSGAAAPRDVVRASMLVRANCLARGHSGIRREVLRLLVDCLAHDIVPVIPERGSVGASGDLVPLSYLVNVLTGSGEVNFHGQVCAADEALRACGLAPVVLEAKEGLALINGTSFMAGFALLAAYDAMELALVADLCTALSVEVLLANRGHFAPFIHDQKPHRGQVRSAARIRALLAGSGLAQEHSQILSSNPKLGDKGMVTLTRSIQDRYSLRCAPHVVGVLHDTLRWVSEWLDTEINSTNDNPLFDADAREVHSGGNFYGGHVGQAMDALKLAIANLGDLMDRQFALVVDEKFNHGLTPNLIPRFAEDDPQAGLHHGFKAAQLHCSALTAEALKLTNPASAFSRSTEAHNQDKVSMGTIAARDARTIVDLVQHIAAIHLVGLCQAAELRGAAQLGRGTRAAYDLVREHVRFLDRDRRLDGDVTAVVNLIKARTFSSRIDAAVADPDAAQT